MNRAEVREAIFEILSSNPDKVAQCNYVVNEDGYSYDNFDDESESDFVPARPECVAGVFFHQRLGFSLNDLVAIEGTNANVICQDLDVDSSGALFLEVIQRAQDAGISWGKIASNLDIAVDVLDSGVYGIEAAQQMRERMNNA